MDNAFDITRPTVVADRNVPFIAELLGDRVNLVQLTPELINAEAVKDADALITRTRTRCDASLLEGSRCSMVATATIGTDHIDFDYCHSHGIEVVSAPGCNAPAVAQYVWSSILRLVKAGKKPSEITVGVVGVGHVGSIVARWGEFMGFKMLLCDPPRALAEGSDGFVDLDVIAREADVITFHTPLTRRGDHPTYHLADKSFFSNLQRRPILINSARGPVTDTEALVDALSHGLISHAVIDCWEGEPAINRDLLAKATYATPHIAGYSLQGKTRASITVARAVCRHLGLEYPAGVIEEPGNAPTAVKAPDILASYDPAVDTCRLRERPADFELLRNRYPLREELSKN